MDCLTASMTRLEQALTSDALYAATTPPDSFVAAADATLSRSSMRARAESAALRRWGIASRTPMPDTMAHSVPSTDATAPDGPRPAGTSARSSPLEKPRRSCPPDVTAWMRHPRARRVSLAVRTAGQSPEYDTRIASVPGPTHPGTLLSQTTGTGTRPTSSARLDTASAAGQQRSAQNMQTEDASPHPW